MCCDDGAEQKKGLLGHKRSTFTQLSSLWKEQLRTVKNVHKNRKLRLNFWTELLLQKGDDPLYTRDKGRFCVL